MKGASSMGTQDNKALVRRIFEEIWNQGNLETVHELFAAEHVGYDQTGPFHGLEGVKQFFSTWLAAFPDAQFHIEDQIAEGDKVATRWTAHGTHRGHLQGIAPTSRQVTVTGITILRIANGKIVESWGNSDTLGMMQQLGVIPSLG
jgi:steroid delta-isomerase-like uncharacterized protein